MKDLTEGSVYRNLILFALPILIGNLLQLTYNAVDSVIVGKYAGETALAAVGISNPIMSILILGASGVSIGASAYTGKCYGAGQKEELKKAFATVLLIGMIMSMGIMLLGFVLTKPVLNIMKVPDEAMMISEIYLRIILLSFPFTFLYNIVTAIVRSVGDSKTPIYFLALSCVINVFLDLILVGKCQLGVAGAGTATLTAEVIACVLCVGYIYKKIPVLSLKKKDLKFDKRTGKIILLNGGITAFQQFMQPIGKVLIQGCIDKYGIGVIAAFNAVNRIDDFACIPEQSISHAMMNYISQCDGAGKDGKKKEIFNEKYKMVTPVNANEITAKVDNNVNTGNGLECYEVSKNTLKEMGLTDLAKEANDGEYAVVYDKSDYKNLDIVYINGIEYNKTKYYTLSSLQKAIDE